MPINVFGNSSNNSQNKIDTSLFVQKPYLKSNYIENNIDEDIDLKNQYKIINLPNPSNIQDACTKDYVDNLFNDRSIIKNNAHIDLNDRNITNARFIQVNQLPQIDSHLTAKLYVDREIDQSSVVRNNKDNDFNNHKLTNIDSVLVYRNPNLDKELANKKYIDDLIREGTLLRFNQTLQNYLKVSIGNDTYNLTKYNKIQLTDITEMKYPNIGSDLLQKWNIKCNNINNQSRITDFIKSTQTNSPSSNTGAMALPPLGSAFMYIETSSNNHCNNIFVSWERTDIIQISNITFYLNRFSIFTNDNLKNMGRFRIQLLRDNTWNTIYTTEKNTQYSDSETEWKLLKLDFNKRNYGIKLILDKIDTAHSDMCFSNIMITHSVY